MLAAVSDADLGEATAINDAAARVGGVIVIALVPALIGVSVASSLADALSLGYQPAMIGLAALAVAGRAHRRHLRHRCNVLSPPRRRGPHESRNQPCPD